MRKHKNCEHTQTERVTLPRWRDDEFLGIDGVILVDSVEQTRCAQCKEELSIFVPNVEGLAHAVALVRAMSPAKLTPKEIAFIRNALDMTQRELADCLQVTNVQVSRWENKQPIGPHLEVLLRAHAVALLREKAPLVVADVEAALDIKPKAVTRRKLKPIGMHRVIRREKRVEWVESAAA